MDADIPAHVMRAFAPVPKPGPENIAPHRCAECDELARDLSQYSGFTLPDAVFEKHAFDLPLLSDDAKHYYLPAWLLRACKKDEWNATDALVNNLQSDHGWNPQTPYTEQQWLVIDAVLALAASYGEQVTVENVERARARLPK